jgi:hypothetical protein
MEVEMAGEPSLLPGPRRPTTAFGFLLAALLALVLVHPFSGQHRFSLALLDLAFAAVIAAGIYAVGFDRKWRAATLLLGIPGIAASGALQFVEAHWLVLVRGAAVAGFLLLTTVLVLREVVRNEKVRGEKIVGSICGYLLLGACWSVVYSILDLVAPGSFSLSEQVTGGTLAVVRARAAELTYFSFVTLTTLGYGDIIPVSIQARTLCWLEAACGQIYLAVLVARLVGLHIVHSERSGRA